MSEVFVYAPPIAEKPGLAVRYTRLLERYRQRFIAIWAFLSLLGCIFGLKFLANTTQVFNPPPSTDSFVARTELGKAFPALDGAGSIIVVAKATGLCDAPGLGQTQLKFPDCLIGGRSMRE